jgi:hypothetical protein
MAALSTIPCYELAALSSREVLVVGTGELAAEVVRGLALLEVGMVSLVDPQRIAFSPEEETIWKAFLETQAPGTVVRHLPRGLEVFVLGLEVPSGADLVVTCDIDGRLRAVVRRALGRCLVPWIEIGTYGSVCSLTTYLPGPADPGSAPHGLVRYGGASQEPGLAATAVLGGLSALEAARVLSGNLGACQQLSNRLFQRRQVFLHHPPDALHHDIEVFMSKDVSCPGDFPPRDFRINAQKKTSFPPST